MTLLVGLVSDYFTFFLVMVKNFRFTCQQIQVQMVTFGFLEYGNADVIGEVSPNNNNTAKCFAWITCPFIL